MKRPKFVLRTLTGYLVLGVLAVLFAAAVIDNMLGDDAPPPSTGPIPKSGHWRGFSTRNTSGTISSGIREAPVREPEGGEGSPSHILEFHRCLARQVFSKVENWKAKMMKEKRENGFATYCLLWIRIAVGSVVTLWLHF